MKKNYIKKTARLHTPSVLKAGKKLLALGGLFMFSLSAIMAQNASYSSNTIPVAGINCTAFGYQSLFSNNAGSSNNTGFGYKTLYANTTGTQNTAIGFMVLPNTTTGWRNTGIGSHALHLNTTGEENTATGWQALYSNTTAHGNTANGSNALALNTVGSFNTAMGTQALYTNVDGSSNVALGNRALYLNSSGNYNTATGSHALNSNTTGYSNTGIGYNSLYLNTTGSLNQALGQEALYSNTTGYQNSGLGYQSLYNNTSGYQNTGVGNNTLYSNTTGYWNTAIGYLSMHDNTEGYLNTAVGFNALPDNTTGDYNAGVGYDALYLNTNGRGNCGLGFYSLGTNTVGDYNSAIGYGADVNANNYSNSSAIGHNAIVTASNKIRFGDANVTVVEGPVAYTISDGRFKDNISETDVKGLEFIKLLRPVVYNFDSRKFEDFLTQHMPDSLRSQYMNQDFTGSTAIRQSGFIAQEVEDAAKESGYNFNGVHTPENENDNYSLAYAQFVVPLVKGMQEQQLMIEELQKQLLDLQNQLASTQSLNKTKEVIVVYPNPGKGLVNITLPEIKNGTVEVLTLEGRSIYNGIIMPGTTTYQLDLTAEAKGIYMVNIFSEGKAIASEKLIIE